MGATSGIARRQSHSRLPDLILGSLKLSAPSSKMFPEPSFVTDVPDCSESCGVLSGMFPITTLNLSTRVRVGSPVWGGYGIFWRKYLMEVAFTLHSVIWVHMYHMMCVCPCDIAWQVGEHPAAVSVFFSLHLVSPENGTHVIRHGTFT